MGELVETGLVPAAEYLDHVRQTSRDNARTPMQWTAEPHGGFTKGRSWLAVNPNYTEINAAMQLDDPDSVFHYHLLLPDCFAVAVIGDDYFLLY